jgi:hypothetical protein
MNRSGAEQQTDPRLQLACLGALSTLTVQFLLGMGVNLFVKVPDSHPGARPSEYFSGSIQSVVWALGSGMLILALHIVIGLLLLGSAIGVAWLAFASRGVVLSLGGAGRGGGRIQRRQLPRLPRRLELNADVGGLRASADRLFGNALHRWSARLGAPLPSPQSTPLAAAPRNAPLRAV